MADNTERQTLIDELNATVEWMKRTGNLVDADRVMRAIAALRENRYEKREPVTSSTGLGDEFLERAKARGAALSRFPLVSAEPMREAYVAGWIECLEQETIVVDARLNRHDIHAALTRPGGTKVD